MHQGQRRRLDLELNNLRSAQTYFAAFRSYQYPLGVGGQHFTDQHSAAAQLDAIGMDSATQQQPYANPSQSAVVNGAQYLHEKA
jgi:hypothetical protein